MTTPITLDDIDTAVSRDAARRRERRCWGRWHLDTNTLELIATDTHGRGIYFIDLERMGTSAAVLDWIFQVTGKTWCSRKDAGDLIAALRDILDPQARLCSFACSSGGDGTRIDATRILRARYGKKGAPR